ncbi:hypothetical protein Pla108_12190 [Botrimarina colliarenosi]|uniref:Dockerin domain-containing protein n=1 Tax=Botrimarina colliarenosi TaxID=2528001 RepID=A0A5C6ALI7_9BACT|nr:BNR-4 repeat-containing protein [Botrimarina colliarenosi]TWU00271.1 hypothetical protein Pla108_12190 [Botrimarina colliarenosi]
MSKANLTTSLLASCLIAMTPTAAVGRIDLNVINGGFETGSLMSIPAGWSVAPGSNPFWTGDSSLAGADPGDGYAGSNQFISANWPYGGYSDAGSLIGGEANAALLYQDIDLTPYGSQIGVGDLYLGLSYAYFDNDPNDLGTISYDFFDAGGGMLGAGYVGDTQAGGGWAFVENLQATEVPSNAARLRISLGAERIGAGTQRNIAFDAVAASLQPPPPPGPVTDIVHGNLIQFDSDGNWTWYTDERTIVDPNNGHVLVNSVGFDETVQGGGYPGNVDVVDFNPTTGRRVVTRLSNQTSNPAIQNDDHNVGALLVLPDGRYLAMYANHGNNGGLGDEFTRFRVSTNPGDSTSWSEEKLYNWFENVPGASTHPGGTAEFANVSYHNLFYLSEEDQVYDISRSYGLLSTNGAAQNMPNVLRYDPDTNSVEWAGQLLESDAQGYSAYPKYVSNGVDRIYFATTETHPRNYNNSIFAGYIEGGQTFDLMGNTVDDNLFDSNVTAGNGSVPDVTDFTLVASPDPLGQGTNRLWTSDAALDSNGNLMVLYTSRSNPDGLTNDGGTNNPIDHRLHFAHWNPATSTWVNKEIARMGDRLYGPEQDYTGVGALIPGDENTLYISTYIDPRDPTGQTETSNHEIYRGKYDGSQWNWHAVTENSSVDNLRPIAPDTHGAAPQSVFWFRGDYNTAHDINAAVVGIIDRDEIGPSRPVTYVDATPINTTRTDGSPIASTAASNAAGAADNLWHERTGFGNGGSVLASNESGAEDAAALKTTVTGLDAGVYEVFAYFWSDNDEDWRLLTGLESDNLMDFRKYGSQHADEDQFDNAVTVAANNNDLLLYRVYLGRESVAAGGSIEVFVDDWTTLNGSLSRTWFDWVGYSLAAPLLAGDYNGDGTVDAADYTVWRDLLGTTGLAAYASADGDGDGEITLLDYDIWRSNYGATIDTVSSLTAPEPGSITVLLPALAVARRLR